MGFQKYGQKWPLFEKYRDGGLTEYIRAPFWLIDELPDSISFDVASKVNEMATALCTLKKANLQPGSTVIITSPTGSVGTSMLKMAHQFPISRIVLVGRSSERLEAVRKLTSIRVDKIAIDQLPDDWESNGGLRQAMLELLPDKADAFIDLTPSGDGAVASSRRAANTRYPRPSRRRHLSFPTAYGGNHVELLVNRGNTQPLEE